MRVLQSYHRTTIADACQMTQEQEPSLVVWVKNQDGWSQVQAHVLNSLWQREGSRSLCNLLLQDVFRLSDGEYRAVVQSIDSSDGLAGMYQNNNEPRNYVLAIELPRSHMGKVAGGLAGGAALALGGLFAHKNKQAIREFLSGKTTVKNAESGQRIVDGLRPDMTRESMEILTGDKALNSKFQPKTQGLLQAELAAQEESKSGAGSLDDLSFAHKDVELTRLTRETLSPNVTLLEILTAAQSKSPPATQGLLQAEPASGAVNDQTSAPQDVEFARLTASNENSPQPHLFTAHDSKDTVRVQASDYIDRNNHFWKTLNEYKQVKQKDQRSGVL